MKKGITTDEWNQLEAILKEKGIDPKTVLPLWNGAMRKVFAAAMLDGKIAVLSALTNNMQERNQPWTSTVSSSLIPQS